MKLCIELGEIKKRQIKCGSNQLLGRLVAELNQQEVKRNVRFCPDLNHKPALDSGGGLGFSFGSDAGGQRAFGHDLPPEFRRMNRHSTLGQAASRACGASGHDP